VGLQKLSSIDGFVIVDLDGAAHADGIVRCAKKVLIDGARTMARSRTYSWALLERQVSGASAGINAVPEDRDAAVRAFVDEVKGQIDSASLLLDPGKGVTAEDLAPLCAVDGRVPLDDGLDTDLLAVGVAAAADVASGGISGTSVVIEGAGPAGEAVAAELTAAGATVVATGDGPDVPRTDSDVLVCGSKLGLVDHELAEVLPQRVIVPCAPAPVTAKGLAVASRRGIVVMADFLTVLGPLLGLRPDAGSDGNPIDSPDPDDLRAVVDRRVRQLATDVLDHPDGPYLGAAYLAEEFLRTWRDPLPFGRPLA